MRGDSFTHVMLLLIMSEVVGGWWGWAWIFLAGVQIGVAYFEKRSRRTTDTRTTR